MRKPTAFAGGSDLVKRPKSYQKNAILLLSGQRSAVTCLSLGLAISLGVNPNPIRTKTIGQVKEGKNIIWNRRGDEACLGYEINLQSPGSRFSTDLYAGRPPAQLGMIWGPKILGQTKPVGVLRRGYRPVLWNTAADSRLCIRPSIRQTCPGAQDQWYPMAGPAGPENRLRIGKKVYGNATRIENKSPD